MASIQQHQQQPQRFLPMTEESKKAEGGDFFQSNMKAAAVGPPPLSPGGNDLESGGADATLPGYDDGSSDRGTVSVLTFLKVVSVHFRHIVGFARVGQTPALTGSSTTGQQPHPAPSNRIARMLSSTSEGWA